MNFDGQFYIVILVAFLLYTLKLFGIFSNWNLLFLSRDKKWKLNRFYGKHFHFYNELNVKDRERFIKRAFLLSGSINIVGRQDFKVTDDVRLFVVAAQVQLTFGFKRYFLPKFKTILIYPDAYKNKLTGNMHYGEVNPKGIIVLSWKRLVKGFEIPDDKINLGLHEMAHALMSTIIRSNDHENGLDPYLREIVKLSAKEREKIKNNDYHFFRKYAGSNIFEFFAVAVECFFEVPIEFKNELPTLYMHMVKLLKQDPTSFMII
jgi:MtfA peptidase